MEDSVFFGFEDEQMLNPAVKAAKAVCHKCPVQIDCLAISLLREEDWGIWGGYLAHERRTALARHNGDINSALDEHVNGKFVHPRKRKKNNDS